MKEMIRPMVQGGNSSQLHPRPDCGSAKLLPMVSEFQAWPPERALALALTVSDSRFTYP